MRTKEPARSRRRNKDAPHPLGVIAAKAGIQWLRGRDKALGPGFRRDDAHEKSKGAGNRWDGAGDERDGAGEERTARGVFPRSTSVTEGTMDGFVALYIFMLAAFTGHEIISRVPVILHTPLMSGSNFVHGIVLVGAMVVLAHADTTLERVIGFLAVALGAGNAAGGYVVTERMLEMFKSSKQQKPA
jgi:NAD(P) transhydrogenase subunit alpha